MRTVVRDCIVAIDEIIKVHCPTSDAFVAALTSAKVNQIFLDSGTSTNVAWFEVTGVTFFSPQLDKSGLSKIASLLAVSFDEIPAGAADAAMEM